MFFQLNDYSQNRGGSVEERKSSEKRSKFKTALKLIRRSRTT